MSDSSLPNEKYTSVELNPSVATSGQDLQK